MNPVSCGAEGKLKQAKSTQKSCGEVRYFSTGMKEGTANARKQEALLQPVYALAVS